MDCVSEQVTWLKGETSLSLGFLFSEGRAAPLQGRLRGHPADHGGNADQQWGRRRAASSNLAARDLLSFFFSSFLFFSSSSACTPTDSHCS